MMKAKKDNNKLYLNAMRSVALQAIYNAGQGHTGMAISAIPIIYTIYRNMNIEKSDPKWINRDRFILSAGHGSMALYSLFYLSGLIDLKDIKNYRNGSKITAGHPEITSDNYIDCATGPLGQGIANAVGMAIAEKYLANYWKKLNGIIDHYTYVVVGDGDLQEGICYEAMSLAGKLKLNKLIVLHDSNDFQLDSKVTAVNNENLKMRIESQNWKYLKCKNDILAIDKCIKLAKKSNTPTFIEVKTIIGEGTSAANSFKAHGLKITKDEIINANHYFGMNFDNFNFPKEIFKHFQKNIIDKGHQHYLKWKDQLNIQKKKNSKLVKDFEKSLQKSYYNPKIQKIIDELKKNDAIVPTKTYFKEFFNLTKKYEIKDILTLSADLASTTNCCNDEKTFNDDVNASYIMMGIREFCMGAVQNGILLHQGLKAFSGTFLTFSDYIKPAIRVGAMCLLPSYYILTHDSYLVGGDGPTHQPYDQLSMLRAIENVYDLRPCNRNEFANGMLLALNKPNYTFCFILTRQNVNVKTTIDNDLKHGAYILKNTDNADYALIASGSEVELIFNHCEEIENTLKVKIKIISAPIPKLFLEQKPSFIKNIIDAKKGVMVVEASNDGNWYQLQQYCNFFTFIKAYKFGASMDGDKVYKKQGFSVENIINELRKIDNNYNK